MGVLLIARRKSIVKSIDIVSYTGTYEKDSNGDVRFLTGGVLVLEKGVTIDAYLVGGGGAGRYGGGGGGYTKTARKIQLIAGQEYEIVIGEGGVATQSTSASAYGTDGEETTAFGYEAAGGKTNKQSGSSTKMSGADGGSGGGAGRSTNNPGMDGGSNGMDGIAASSNAVGGTGQGYTTRAFGEESGKLYAAGGGGCPGSSSAEPGKGGEGGGGDGSYNTANDVSGKPNTGSGGGGTYTPAGRISNGGSGIVIIRTAKAASRQYLYGAGDEHAGLTNGWIGEPKWSQDGSGATKRANIARESGQIVLDNSNNYAGVIRPALGVDLTPYKTLVFEGEFTRGGSSAKNLIAAVWSTIGTFYATENQMLKFYQMASTGTVDRIEIDVSNIDGLGYPGIGVTMSSAKITACYLIPKD
jgi:hypothetical protein